MWASAFSRVEVSISVDAFDFNSSRHHQTVAAEVKLFNACLHLSDADHDRWKRRHDFSLAFGYLIDDSATHCVDRFGDDDGHDPPHHRNENLQHDVAAGLADIKLSSHGLEVQIAAAFLVGSRLQGNEDRPRKFNLWVFPTADFCYR